MNITPFRVINGIFPWVTDITIPEQSIDNQWRVVLKHRTGDIEACAELLNKLLSSLSDAELMMKVSPDRNHGYYRA